MQKNCGTAANHNDCKTVHVDLSEEKIYEILYKIQIKGGNTIDYHVKAVVEGNKENK